MALVLLSAWVESCFVSRMRDFFKLFYWSHLKIKQQGVEMSPVFLFASLCLYEYRTTSRKGMIMANIIQTSIILTYAVVGKLWQMPRKLQL